jgi:large subunit ribosomal protein L10
MAQSEKETFIRELTEIFQKSKSVFVTDFSGLNVENIMRFRKKCGETRVSFLVVKNTLARISAKQAGFEQIGKYFKGPSAIAYSYDDPSSPARVIKEFNKTNNKPQIKVSLFEGVFYGPESIDVIASLPSRNELIAKVLGGLNSPIQGLVGSLHGLLQKLVRTLDAVKTHKEKSS